MSADLRSELDDLADPVEAEAPPDDDDDDRVAAEHQTVSHDQREELRRQKVRAQELENDRRADDIQLRRTTARWFLFGTAGWLMLVLIIVVLSGTGTLQLSDKVLMMLLGTTTGNIIGLLVIMANYLFPRQ